MASSLCWYPDVSYTKEIPTRSTFVYRFFCAFFWCSRERRNENSFTGRNHLFRSYQFAHRTSLFLSPASSVLLLFSFLFTTQIFAVMTEKKSLQRHHITIGIFLNFPPSFKTYHYSFGIEIKISEDARIVWDDSERFGWREKQNKLRWNRKNFSSRFTEIFISELYHSRIMNILTYFYYLRQEIFYLDALFPLFLVPGRVKNQVSVSRDLQDWTQISAALLV